MYCPPCWWAGVDTSGWVPGAVAATVKELACATPGLRRKDQLRGPPGGAPDGSRTFTPEGMVATSLASYGPPLTALEEEAISRSGSPTTGCDSAPPDTY